MTRYVVERREPLGKWSQVASTPDTTCTVKGLKEGTEYEFRVAAENKAGLGDFGEASAPTVAKEPYGKRAPAGWPRRLAEPASGSLSTFEGSLFRSCALYDIVRFVLLSVFSTCPDLLRL